MTGKILRISKLLKGEFDMKDFLKLIKKGVSVMFTERSERPWLSNNGGEYNIYTIVQRFSNNIYLVTVWSSCDFSDDTEEIYMTIPEIRRMLHGILKKDWSAERI